MIEDACAAKGWFIRSETIWKRRGGASDKRDEDMEEHWVSLMKLRSQIREQDEDEAEG
jgi:hypothetical protein